ncbi:MAG: cysteine synthase family protein [Lachnospiraceae bacterium]|nr:cysteine synthase family protein [Lachnospiraceae bacterium]
MSNIKHAIEEVVGHTPILELDGLEKKEQLESHILVKLESVNPLGSLKDRIAVAMIDALERDTDIKPGDTIVEFSSGNTAIGLAAIAAKRGYKMIAYMVQATVERIKLLEAYGATVRDMLEDAEVMEAMRALPEDGDSAQALVELFKERSKKEGINYFLTVQSSNEANREVQYRTTGQEIIEDVDQVDVLIAGVGSGGSITGVSEALREKFPNLEVVAFEPTDDDTESLVGVHSISLTPKNTFPQIILRKEKVPYDRIVKVHKEDAYRMANKVARTDGIFLGITAGAAMHVAAELAKTDDYKGKTFVLFGYDDVLKYLSSELVDKKYAYKIV